MSYSSLKNRSNVFRSENLRKTGDILRQPIAIASLAAVGVHGLLWFGLPLLSPENKTPDDSRSVRVVELSPLEQSRIPQMPLTQGLAPSPKTTLPLSDQPLAPGTALDPAAPPIDGFPNYKVPGLADSPGSAPTPDFNPKPKPKARTQPNKPIDPDKETPENPQPENSSKPGGAADLGGTESKSTSRNTQQTEQSLPAKYAYSATGTTIEDWGKQVANANAAIGAKYDSIRDLTGKPIKLLLSYPKEACQFKAEIEKNAEVEKQKVSIGFSVVARPETGEVVEKFLTRSSGFKGFDEAAAKSLQEDLPKYLTKKWKDDEGEPPKNPQAYTVEMTIGSPTEICTAETPSQKRS